MKPEEPSCRNSVLSVLRSQGSVTDTSQPDGTLGTARQYDAWGNYRNATAPQSGDPKIGYTGHQFDPETGLTYARARYYDSETGIFLSPDPREPPAADAPWLHRYAYARGNATRYVDVDGLDVGAARVLTPEEMTQQDNQIFAIYDQTPILSADGRQVTRPKLALEQERVENTAKLNSLLGAPLAAGAYGVMDTLGVDPKTRYKVTGVLAATENSVYSSGPAGPAALRIARNRVQLPATEAAVRDELGGLARQRPALNAGLPIGVKGVEGASALDAQEAAAPSQSRLDKTEVDAFAAYMSRVETLDVGSTRNGSVFYSGKGQRALAEEFATGNDRTTLERTAGGQWLEQQGLFRPNSPLTPDQANAVWSRLSQRFAQGASGNAVGFVEGARPGGIFNSVEFPELLKNPNVTNVITGGH